MSELDSTFRALADGQRRLALSCLQKHQSLSLPDLAEFVAEREEDQDISELSGERVREVYFSLYHNHIPILEEADLLHYDQEQDLVARTERTEPALENAREKIELLLEEV